MKVNGGTISQMAKENSDSMTGVFMLDNLKMVVKMGMENIIGLIILLIRAFGKITSLEVKVLTFGAMEENTSARGRTTQCMEKAS